MQILKSKNNSVWLCNGDVMEVLKVLPSNSVHCCITSPPYWGLRDYGTAVWDGGDANCDHKTGRFTCGGMTKMQSSNFGSSGYRANSTCPKCGARRVDCQIGLEATPEEYVDKIVEVFREVRRVLRDDGILWLNLGDTYASGKGTCYNPGGGERSLGKDRKLAGAHPLNRGSVVSLRKSGLKPKDLIGIPWRVAFALQADGWYLRSDVIWAKGVSFCPTYAGSSMPESIKDRPSKSHEYIFLFTKASRYFFDKLAIAEPAQYAKEHSRKATSWGPSGKMEAHGIGKSNRGDYAFVGDNHTTLPGGLRNVRTVWTINPKPFKGSHFAVFPPKLVELCILSGTSEYGCCPRCGKQYQRVVKRVGGAPTTMKGRKELGLERPPSSFGGPVNEKETNPLTGSRTWRPPTESESGPAEFATTGWSATCSCNTDNVAPCIVLDPFSGSGTVASVAASYGRKAIGIELNPDYIEISIRRIREDVGIVFTDRKSK